MSRAFLSLPRLPLLFLPIPYSLSRFLSHCVLLLCVASHRVASCGRDWGLLSVTRRHGAQLDAEDARARQEQVQGGRAVQLASSGETDKRSKIVP